MSSKCYFFLLRTLNVFSLVVGLWKRSAFELFRSDCFTLYVLQLQWLLVKWLDWFALANQIVGLVCSGQSDSNVKWYRRRLRGKYLYTLRAVCPKFRHHLQSSDIYITSYFFFLIMSWLVVLEMLLFQLLSGDFMFFLACQQQLQTLCLLHNARIPPNLGQGVLIKGLLPKTRSRAEIFSFINWWCLSNINSMQISLQI